MTGRPQRGPPPPSRLFGRGGIPALMVRIENPEDKIPSIDRKLKLGIADGSMELDGKVIYVTKDMRVGLFS